jgi:hypothetical protein
MGRNAKKQEGYERNKNKMEEEEKRALRVTMKSFFRVSLFSLRLSQVEWLSPTSSLSESSYGGAYVKRCVQKPSPSGILLRDESNTWVHCKMSRTQTHQDTSYRASNLTNGFRGSGSVSIPSEAP